MLRAARFALLALTAFLMIGAATASAQPRMPIGFFDDPTFRWSADRMDNLQRASEAGASIIHTTANWAALAPINICSRCESICLPITSGSPFSVWILKVGGPMLIVFFPKASFKARF